MVNQNLSKIWKPLLKKDKIKDKKELRKVIFNF